MKEKVHKRAVRPAGLFGLETAALTLKQEAVGVKDVEIVFGRGEDGQDEERAHQSDSTGGDKVRESTPAYEYMGRRMLEVELPGGR